MEYIYIAPSETGEEGALCGVATDGKRLHIVDPLCKSITEYGLIPGHWSILKKLKKPIIWAARLNDIYTTAPDMKFADYKKVMPTGKPEYTTTFSGFCLGSGTHRNFGELARFLHDFPDTTAINLNYLHDLGTDSKWSVEWYGANKALKFTESTMTAVIMPMIF